MANLGGAESKLNLKNSYIPNENWKKIHHVHFKSCNFGNHQLLRVLGLHVSVICES